MDSTNKRDGGEVARQFHEAYERLAPSFGYETRQDTREFDPKSPNGRLMIAVCTEVMERALAESRAEVERLRAEEAAAEREVRHQVARAAKRAERLAGALRSLLGSVDDLTSYMAEDDEIGHRPCCNVLSYNEHTDDCAITQARAALEQEPQE